MNISLAHEYHGFSLIRAYLGIKPDENYTVTAKIYEFRSPIRKNTIKVQGVRGEMIDDTIYYLDDVNDRKSQLCKHII